MPNILSSIACNADADVLTASFPLLEAGKIEAIEWSFDVNSKPLPGWFRELLTAFSQEKRLIGHGVFFSLFSGKWSPDQHQWLKHLKQVSSVFSFDHITEHFGFMTGQHFHHGAPLPIPFSPTTLRIGRDRLARIYEACSCPVGLENLAFSYSLDQVKRHGEFLEQLIAAINGFIILDLHNLYCQIHNFSIPYDQLIALYPLDRVREIHISGGSWEDSAIEPARKIRRDTHDEAVPQEVFTLLEHTIEKCPNLKYVVLEQLGTGLKSERSRKLFYDDFIKLEKIVTEKNKILSSHSHNPFIPLHPLRLSDPVEDEMLYDQQLQLSSILESAGSYTDAIHVLQASSLADSLWHVENWDPSMVETAIRIAQKWKKQ